MLALFALELRARWEALKWAILALAALLCVLGVLAALGRADVLRSPALDVPVLVLAAGGGHGMAGQAL